MLQQRSTARVSADVCAWGRDELVFRAACKQNRLSEEKQAQLAECVPLLGLGVRFEMRLGSGLI